MDAGSRPIKNIGIRLSEVEEQLIQQEAELGLSWVYYSVFEQAIKRYGYTEKSELTVDMLNEVADIIRLNVQAFDEPENMVKKYYRGEKVFDHGNYKVKHLLLLGFLFCNHISKQKQHDSLWGIINPELEDTVSK